MEVSAGRCTCGTVDTYTIELHGKAATTVDDRAGSSFTWAIEVQDLTKLFGDYHALRDVDLRVKKGGRLVILGPNGAGKTTLVKLLATISKPSAGSIRLDGIDVAYDPVQVRRKIGVVGHGTLLYSDLTLYENLRFYGQMYDVPHLEHRVREVVLQVQVESRLHDRVGTLSRGLQQRASIARAVIHNPSIMLLDEPEVGLDPHAVAMMRDVLDTVKHTERTVVMTTHNLEQGLALADQIAILNRGRLVYQALADETQAESLREIYDDYTRSSK